VTSSVGASDEDLALLREIFFAESEEGLQAMEDALVALEARPEDKELVQTIFRAAHTLKGGAVSLGLGALSEFAHNTEDILDRLRSGSTSPTPGVVGLLLECVDAMREMLSAELAARR